jgi:hypothetical protein
MQCNIVALFIAAAAGNNANNNVVVQVAIDSTCATVAEVRKRGDEFWGEFEFYLSDLLVGLVMDVVLVGLMAPTAVIGRMRPVAAGGAFSLLHCGAFTLTCTSSSNVAPAVPVVAAAW